MPSGVAQDDPVIIGIYALQAPFFKIVKGVGKTGGVFEGKRISVVKFSKINVRVFICLIQNFSGRDSVQDSRNFGVEIIGKGRSLEIILCSEIIDGIHLDPCLDHQCR